MHLWWWQSNQHESKTAMLTRKGQKVLREINKKYRFPIERGIDRYYLTAQLLEYESTGNEAILKDLRLDYSENYLIEQWWKAVENKLIRRW